MPAEVDCLTPRTRARIVDREPVGRIKVGANLGIAEQGVASLLFGGFGDESVFRREVDDPAFDLRGDHAFGDTLREEEDGVEIDRHHATPMFGRDLIETLEVGHARVVDEDVDLARHRPRFISQCVELIGRGEILLDDPRLAAEGTDFASDFFRGGGGGVVDDDDIRVVLGQAERDAFADAARAAGDECGFAGEVEA